ncbi:hypothetical protein B4U79_18521, partial [Dinothrombium tinctorium]
LKKAKLLWNLRTSTRLIYKNMKLILRHLIEKDLMWVFVSSKCPDNRHKFKNKCYHINQTTASFYENYKYCNSLNASTVTIHSLDELNYLVSKNGSNMNDCFWLEGVHVTNDLSTIRRQS